MASAVGGHSEGNLTVLKLLDGLADGVLVNILTNFDSGRTQGLKCFGPHETGEQDPGAGGGNDFSRLDAGAPGHDLGSTVVDVVTGHGLQIDNGKTGGTPEAWIDAGI